MANTNQLHETIKRQAEAVKGSREANAFLERINQPQSEAVVDTVRRLNACGPSHERMSHLLQSATLALPAPLAEFLSRQALLNASC